MGSYPSWLRRFTVNKLAIAIVCSTHTYPILKSMILHRLSILLGLGLNKLHLIAYPIFDRD